MSVYFWLMLAGKLGTATVSRGRVEDFSPAMIMPSLHGAPASLVTVLESEVEYGALGKLLLNIAGGTHLACFCVDAVPARRVLFAKGLEYQPTFLPKFDFECATLSSADYFSVSKLAMLNLNLNAPSFVQDITGWANSGETVFDLTLADLPAELELVVTKRRRFQHGTEAFRVDTDIQVVGLHERTVAKIEGALRVKPGANPSFVKALENYKRYSTTRRAICGKLRIGISEIMSRMCGASSDTKEFDEILDWIGRKGAEGSQPRFLANQLNELYANYETNKIPGLRAEFASLRSDLLDAVREFVTFLPNPNE